MHCLHRLDQNRKLMDVQSAHERTCLFVESSLPLRLQPPGMGRVKIDDSSEVDSQLVLGIAIVDVFLVGCT